MAPFAQLHAKKETAHSWLVKHLSRLVANRERIEREKRERERAERSSVGGRVSVSELVGKWVSQFYSPITVFVILKCLFSIFEDSDCYSESWIVWSEIVLIYNTDVRERDWAVLLSIARERERERERVCDCVWTLERDMRDRMVCACEESECVPCVHAHLQRERECVCVCVCVWPQERQRR